MWARSPTIVKYLKLPKNLGIPFLAYGCGGFPIVTIIKVSSKPSCRENPRIHLGWTGVWKD